MTAATATTLSPIFAAAAEVTKEPAIVSVHDVAPATRASSEKILSSLGQLGIRITSLLVVPNYHRRGSSMTDRGFVNWLHELEERGHEIVIHGYFHERPRREAESFTEKFTTRFYTQDEGEFYDLEYDEAFRRINQAREEFAAAGFKPRGFIAPAWLLGAEAERAARDAEMEYTTRLGSVLDLRTRENFRSRSLVYSVRSGWRRVASLAVNGALNRQLISAPLMRLSIHPPDFEHAEIWQQIKKIGAAIAESRTPTTYRDWVADRRTRASLES